MKYIFAAIIGLSVSSWALESNMFQEQARNVAGLESARVRRLPTATITPTQPPRATATPAPTRSGAPETATPSPTASTTATRTPSR